MPTKFADISKASSGKLYSILAMYHESGCTKKPQNRSDGHGSVLLYYIFNYALHSFFVERLLAII